MNKIYAVANQKGGCGKTTLTLNLGAALANMGSKVLLLDADPQANMTMALGYDQPDELPITVQNNAPRPSGGNSDERNSIQEAVTTEAEVTVYFR